MKEFLELYNSSRDIMQNLDSIAKSSLKLKVENFKTLKAIELIKQAVNNSLAETLILSDFLYELTIIEDVEDLNEFLDLTDFDYEDDFDIEVPKLDTKGNNDETTD